MKVAKIINDSSKTNKLLCIRILQELIEGPATVGELRFSIGAAQTESVRKAIDMLVSAELVRFRKWVQRKGRGRGNTRAREFSLHPRLQGSRNDN